MLNRRRFRALAFAAVCAAFIADLVLAGTCDLELDEAERRYGSGNFEQALEHVEDCLEGRPSRDERVQALAIRAKIFVAMDDMSRAAEAVEELIYLDEKFEPARSDPSMFLDLVERTKQQDAVITVASVSKSDEPLREAPATVVVVTAEEIERRGYVDLEALFHDLPGFDISRSRGITYSNIYQRGFRSGSTDRILFLIDGVEQNDLWSNIAYISRQYPLTNVDRIEVIYGPASTMYGANAFTGVVHVITREPEAFLEDGRSQGGLVEIGAGEWDTRLLEANVAGRFRGGSIGYLITARMYRSDEMDLSTFADWNFDPVVFQDFDYANVLNIGGTDLTGNPRAQSFIDDLAEFFSFELPEEHPYYRIHRNSDDVATLIELTPEGIEQARYLDTEGYRAPFDGTVPGFANATDTWSLNAKLDLPNLDLGLQLWQRKEGSMGSFSDVHQAGNLSEWGPRSLSFYLKYDRAIGRSLALRLFSRYKLHDLGNHTRATRFLGYASGSLDLLFLLFDSPSRWDPRYLHQSSTQLRNELTLSYEPSKKLSVVGGLEVRNSSIQSDLIQSFEPDPARTGGIDPQIDGAESLDQLDLGLYAQATFKPWRKLRTVVGGRLDHNEVRDGLGYGTVFNPRLALVYPVKDFVFKVVYAEAFKDASNFQKYSTFTGVFEERNPDLETEKVKNLELSAGWQPTPDLALDVVGYSTSYSNVVGLQDVANSFACDVACQSFITGQFQNVGKFEVRGIQATIAYSIKNLKLFGNYTFTDPVNTNPSPDALGIDPSTSEVPVGDIARNRLNLGFNAVFRDRLNVNLRMNYVGDKKTGRGTTVPSNTFTEIDAYTVVNAAVTYRGTGGVFQKLKLQLAAQNLLDEEYHHPGIRQAGTAFAARLPQPGRSLFFRLALAY